MFSKENNIFDGEITEMVEDVSKLLGLIGYDLVEIKKEKEKEVEKEVEKEEPIINTEEDVESPFDVALNLFKELGLELGIVEDVEECNCSQCQEERAIIEFKESMFYTLDCLEKYGKSNPILEKALMDSSMFLLTIGELETSDLKRMNTVLNKIL